MPHQRLNAIFNRLSITQLSARSKLALLLLGLLLLALLLFLISLFNDARHFQDHAEYRKKMMIFQLDKNLIAEKWLAAADASLQEPAKMPPSYRESGWFHPNHQAASAWKFSGFAKQTLKVRLTTPSNQPGYIFVDLLAQKKSSEEFRTLKFDARNFQKNQDDSSKVDREFIFSIDDDKTYYLRLQPELLFAGSYELAVDLENAYVFPVEGKDSTDIRSFFGDPREGGKRVHQGVDIFAARGTPVLAVADGRISRVNTSPRGGKHVWQKASDGRRIYYAHLEDFAITSGKRIKQGDVIGFVGNSGNAINTRPHLHFEIRELGRGAINPAPHIYTRRIDETPTKTLPSTAVYARVKSKRLNLRAGPGLQFAVVTTLNQHELLQHQGSSSQWSRVSYGNRHGYVFSRHIATQLEPLHNIAREKGDFFYAAPNQNTRLSQFSAVETLSAFGYMQGWILAKKAGEYIWLAPQQAASSTS